MSSTNLEEHQDKSFAQIRNQKILECAKRQLKRTDTEKEDDFEELTEEQQVWHELRMCGTVRSWERWNGVIEEWEPWNRYGEPVNIWSRYYKK